jgi:SAM-dependent methyltransferase
MPEAPEAWPGGDRRNPSLGTQSWSIREPLSRWLEAEGKTAAGLRVLDVGCGVKPYLPYFATAREYVGVDIERTEHADLVGSIERIPVDDASFDVVLCIQVLEHVDDPSQGIRELHRVTRPGGRVLLSTHGTHAFHPSPADHWRWTHTGLERLFETSGLWRSVTVTPGAGTCACLGMLTANYVDLATKRIHAVWLGYLVNRVINRVAGWMDRIAPSLREPQPGSLFANYHVVAER